ncbi:36918_t:CDS:1, partial [Racocetra persica]
NNLIEEKPKLTSQLVVALREYLQQAAVPYQRITDGRYFRRTGRTIQFTTRVTPDYDKIIREIAHHENCLLVEILEKSLESYCREIN